MVEGSVRDFEPAPGVATTGRQDPGPPSGPRPVLPQPDNQPSPPPRPEGGPGKSRRKPGVLIFGVLKRLWIPILILAVICAGGFTVSRLHGIFCSEKSLAYGDIGNDKGKPFNPKHLRYEVFGPPGTDAVISYFDSNGDPIHEDGVHLPWSLEFPITTAASVGSIAAQGNTGSIGCRILVDGVVKAEKVTNHEVSAFTYCILKAA